MREIATLEVEILRLERLLLSLYRTAFQQHLPRITEDHVETPRGGGSQLNQPSQKTESKIPTSCLGGPHDLVHVSLQKSSSETGRVDIPHLLSLLVLMTYVYVSIIENRRRSKGLTIGIVALLITLEISA